jgi:hypothetical protein
VKIVIALMPLSGYFLFALRMALRNGSVFVNHSFSHREAERRCLYRKKNGGEAKSTAGVDGNPMTVKRNFCSKIEQLTFIGSRLVYLAISREDAAGAHTKNADSRH